MILKKYNFKSIIIFLCCILCCTLSLCSCKKENDDKFVIEALENKKGDIGDTDIAAELGIPQSINYQLSSDIEDMDSVYISDNNITVPDVEKMYVCECERAPFTSDYKKTICENIFSDSTIYIYEEKETVDELNTIIDYYRDLESNSSSEMLKEMYKYYVDEYTELYKTAADTRKENIDFSSNQYIGEINNQKYLLSFIPDGDYIGSVTLELYPREALKQFAGYDYNGDTAFTGLYRDDMYSRIKNGTDEFSEELTELNKCSYNLDEAQNIASKYTSNLMPFKCVLACAEALCFSYTTYEESEEDGSTLVFDGYDMIYTCEIEGVRQFTAELDYVDYIYNMYNDASKSEDEVSTITNGTIFQIAMCSNGIIGMNCEMPIIEKNNLKKAELLDFQTIVDCLEEALPDYYKKHETAFTQIRFNEIELSYYPKSTDDKLIYTPAWIFMQMEEETELPVQIIIIDAVTGDVIEVK